MSDGVKIALIASVTLLLSVFWVTGRYNVVRPAQGTFVYAVDRFTGNGRLCNAEGCRDLPDNPKLPAP